MSQTFIAWNGEEYPWPPPGDWYEGIDGRWWAPNSGPGPKLADQPVPPSDFSTPDPSTPDLSVQTPPATSPSAVPSTPDPSELDPLAQNSPTQGFPAGGFPAEDFPTQGSPIQGSPIQDFPSQRTDGDASSDIAEPTPGFDPGATAQQPAIGDFPAPNFAKPSTPDFDQPDANQTPTPGFNQPDANQTPTPGFNQPNIDQSGFGQPDTSQTPTPGFNQPNIDQSGFGQRQPDQPANKLGPNPLGLGPDLPAKPNAAPLPSSEPQASRKLPLIIAGVIGLVAVVAIGFFALTRGGDEATVEAADETTPETSEVTTTTTTPETTTTAEPTTTTAPVDIAAARESLRAYISAINIVNLTDGDLDSIGAEACGAAAVSIDGPAWDGQVKLISEQIMARQAVNPPAEGTPLTEAAIVEIYNAAATFYCPAEAERLGIVLG